VAGYIPITNFRVKDSFPEGEPSKAVTGAELAAEFESIAVSVRSMVGGYTPLTNFRTKDLLPTGSAEKIIDGAELDAEFDAVHALFNSVPGWSYTRITTFASETTVTGALIDDEFRGLSNALVEMWALGGGSPGGAWTQPAYELLVINAGNLGDIYGYDSFFAIGSITNGSTVFQNQGGFASGATLQILETETTTVLRLRVSNDPSGSPAAADAFHSIVLGASTFLAADAAYTQPGGNDSQWTWTTGTGMSTTGTKTFSILF
jgi:hypothetical protein